MARDDVEITETVSPEVDAAWRTEFCRRVEDIESGEVQLVSHKDTVTAARALLADRRK